MAFKKNKYFTNEQMEYILFAMNRGDAGLNDLPPALMGFYTVGFNDGAQSRQHEINEERGARRKAERDADRLWLENFTPEHRRDFLLDRLDQAMMDADSENVDDLIAEAVLKFMSNLDNMRSAA